MSSWGHSFRPSYLDIPAFLRLLPSGVAVVALTATAYAITMSDKRSLLRLQDAPLLRAGFDRPNNRMLMRRCAKPSAGPHRRTASLAVCGIRATRPDGDCLVSHGCVNSCKYLSNGYILVT